MESTAQSPAAGRQDWSAAALHQAFLQSRDHLPPQAFQALHGQPHGGRGDGSAPTAVATPDLGDQRPGSVGTIGSNSSSPAPMMAGWDRGMPNMPNPTWHPLFPGVPHPGMMDKAQLLQQGDALSPSPRQTPTPTMPKVPTPNDNPFHMKNLISNDNGVVGMGARVEEKFVHPSPIGWEKPGGGGLPVLPVEGKKQGKGAHVCQPGCTDCSGCKKKPKKKASKAKKVGYILCCVLSLSYRFSSRLSPKLLKKAHSDTPFELIDTFCKIIKFKDTNQCDITQF